MSLLYPYCGTSKLKQKFNYSVNEYTKCCAVSLVRSIEWISFYQKYNLLTYNLYFYLHVEYAFYQCILA